MSRIETHRSPHHSIFQSLVERVASRLEEKPGHPLAGSRGEGPSKRKTEGHPAHDVAAHIAGLHRRGEEIPEEPPQELQKKHGSKLAGLWTCAKLSAEAVFARMRGHDETAKEKHDELKFGTCDPEWAEAIVDYLEFFGVEGGRREIPYVRHQSMDDFVLETLPADATVALLGDWGTGTQEAIDVLEAIRDHQPDVLIHLGDVYYAGTDEETRKFFLDVIDRVLDRENNPIPIYTLTGNHDMYSGGTGYYSLLPELNPFDPDLFGGDPAQPASYFSLRSKDGAWQFLAMDTGLHDHDPFTVSSQVTYLEETEEDWHADKIRRFAEGGGRTILLSHHQLFSAFEAIGEGGERPKAEEAANPKLAKSFRRFQKAAGRPGDKGDEDGIAAWFWGHEHNLAVYRPYLGLEKGRCIGHGAIPAMTTKDPYAVRYDLDNPPELVDDPSKAGEPLKLAVHDQTYAHGFVIVQLDDATKSATAKYYQDTDFSTPMYEEEL